MAPADRRATALAALAGALLVAFQLAGKATREALFLSAYPVTDLPRMVIGAAVVSAAATLLLARAMARRGPGVLIPLLAGASGLGLLLEWALGTIAPALVAVLYYLHFSALGAVLISGLWTLVTERFDPREARRRLGPIMAGASAGGLLGGAAAAPLAAWLPVPGLLPLLALLHLAAVPLLLSLRARTAVPTPADAPPGPGPLAALGGSPYLRRLAALAALAALAEGLLDWVFKARALGAIGDGPTLLRFFSLFYTATALAGILVQGGVLRSLIARLGPGLAAAAQPAGVLLGALSSLLLPGLWPVTLARGGEIVLRTSLFRGAGELLFSPVSPGARHATKLLVDVGAARLGDVAGGLLLQLLLLAGVAPVPGRVLVPAGAAALVAMLVALRLRRDYPAALAADLAARAAAGGEAADPRSLALLETMGGYELPTRTPAAAAEPDPPAGPDPDDLVPVWEQRDPARLRAALEGAMLAPEEVLPVVRLLGWDEVAPAAIAALARVSSREAVPLAARMLDPTEPFATRRRLVRVLAEARSPEVLPALDRALDDARFEVRYLAARALHRQLALGAAPPAPGRVYDVVAREVAVGRPLWEGRQLLDDAEDVASPMAMGVLRARADRSLEHVFTLLALVLPRTPVRLACHALHTRDARLRGTALEYLESVLPPAIRAGLWPFLEPEAAPRRAPGRADQVLERLLQSQESIALALEAATRRQP